jgi:UDP-N-acetylmuramyl pentapeptide phosphotransferase/UDP-N-acetylglucosamine-1-phosphate transferase
MSPLVAFIASAVAAFLLIAAAQPLLRRYALARPNVRSSHKKPTSQGGGIFVIAVTLAVAFPPAWVLAATAALALVGAADDLRALPAGPRLALQTAAVFTVVAALPAELRILPVLPWGLERALLVFGGVWFVNLVNFMDGIDWMTAAEVAPVAAALAVFGLMGALPAEATCTAAALAGAIIGFAPFNRPVARLFLGDVGSLPIGLLLAWLLALLAGNGHLAAALLLPLYYLADATLTLLRRVVRGEPPMQAHRSHFYQRAFDGGLGVYRIVGSVFALNLALAALAAATLLIPGPAVQLAALAAGCILVGLLLWRFGRVKA